MFQVNLILCTTVVLMMTTMMTLDVFVKGTELMRTYPAGSSYGTAGSSSGTAGTSSRMETVSSVSTGSSSGSAGSSSATAGSSSGSAGSSSSTAGSSSGLAGSSSGAAGFSGSSSAHAHSSSSAHKSHPIHDPLDGFRIVCLFNNKNFYKAGFTPSMIDASLCTYLNYEFAILDPKTYEMITGEPDLDITQNFYQEAINLKKWNPKLKVLLSLGGWGDSTKKYSEMADDKDKRCNFIAKAVAFLKAHEFDGMDLAWEYPNCWQGAIGISPKDKPNFVLLLKELKTAFDENNLVLSVSVGGIKREIEAAYDVSEISAAVSHINVMTYDMHGPWEPVTGHHTQFDTREGDSDPYCNVKGALEVWIENGADKKKLNMGIAYYGKTFTLADASNYGLGAPAKGIGNPGPVSKNGGFLLYSEICEFLNTGNWTEEEEPGVGFYAHYENQWACYDPPMMVVRKAKYVVDEDLGGILLKDMSGDDYKGLCFTMPFPLTKMARLEMIQKIRQKRFHKE